MNAETLLHEALSKSPAEPRPIFGGGLCRRSATGATVEALLAAQAGAQAVGNSPADAVTLPLDSQPSAGVAEALADSLLTDMPPPASPTGLGQREADSNRLIAGRYLLQRKIGEGGMGEVWQAQQTEPVKRLVALKLIKSGMDSRAVLQRFEQERQALALMDHPNIGACLTAE